MIEIYHPRKKEHVDVTNIELKTYLTPNEATGEDELCSYVQFTTVGKRTEWEDYILLSDFQRHNPKVPLMEGNN